MQTIYAKIELTSGVSELAGFLSFWGFQIGSIFALTTLYTRRFAAPLSRTSVPGASAGRLPSPTVQVATEMNRQFLGWNSHPLASCIFVAHQYIGVFRPDFFL
jgi:hypothetical protein